MNKSKLSQMNSSAETRALNTIEAKTGNLYESISIVSKRSNQINASMKEELHAKLNEFATVNDSLEEVFENREQIEISKYYEKLPNPAIIALNEFMEDEIYHRYPEKEVKTEA